MEERLEALRPRVKNVLRGMVGNVDAVEDLTQDVLVRAFTHRRQFNGQCALFTWVYTVARSVACNHLERAARQKHESLDWGWYEMLPDWPTPARSLVAQYSYEEAMRQLESLAAPERGALQLYLAVDNYEAGAALAGVSLTAFKTRLYRARRNLQAGLS
jgi:RNA polymerase sigma-70 factor (ECF subfamily)